MISWAPVVPVLLLLVNQPSLKIRWCSKNLPQLSEWHRFLAVRESDQPILADVLMTNEVLVVVAVRLVKY